jgi:allophanate hydrolase
MSHLSTTTPLDLQTLRRLYQAQALKPSQLVEAVYERIAACTGKNIWIHLRPQESVVAQARQLEQRRAADLPLYGIPYAVKDNIDVAGAPTTVGCPAFSYTPAESATVVERLNTAGALLIGKTNLDQFATGLVGTRSPYGVCANPFDPGYIAGGSSSGSAVAVSLGLVSFALGTDTAGSGRVPAGFTNTIGLKPSQGLISMRGVFPACRSLDCLSIFALTCQDALAVFEVGQGPDPADPFSRARPTGLLSKKFSGAFRFGVPQPAQLKFFGNREYERLYQEGLGELVRLGGQKVEIDFSPFVETANLLYNGPWLAERLTAVKEFMAQSPEALLPVTAEIIAGGRRFSAVDVFESYYRLQVYRKQVEALWPEIDLLVTPTTGTIYTIAQVEVEPFSLNTNLGYYTNFVNLLDLCAWAIPNGFQQNGLPMGLTLIAPAFQESYLADIAAVFHQSRSDNLAGVLRKTS